MDVSSIFTVTPSLRWEDNAEAWVEEVRKAGPTAEVTGETASDHSPVVLADGDHYVLRRHQEPDGILVSVDYRAVKVDRGWVPADSSAPPVIRRTFRLGERS
ncbi:hypothetical protein ABZ799_26650 [Nocardiopsis dassonvillei]|uniref:hypothetical protein n=1 Tax=Nocardiopsis dassonvillei TaxID=2014 RepID=UPI0033E50605